MNPDCAVLLEVSGSGWIGWIHEFERGFALPRLTGRSGIGVNPGSTEHIVRVDCDRETGDGLKVIGDIVRIDVSIIFHPVVGTLATPVGWKSVNTPGVRSCLISHGIDEDISVGIDVGGNKSRPISNGFHCHGSVHHDRSQIDGSIRFARPATIGGVANDRSRSGGGNDEWERIIVKSTTYAVVGILDETCDTTR